MGLKEDIEQLKKDKKLTKSKILEEHRDDILEMINLKISLSTQIELLIKNNIIEKLDLKEYRNILINDFGYIAKSREKKEVKKQISISAASQKKEAIKVEKSQPQPPKTQKSAKDILSEEINLF
ncbi:MAG: hypothetical protein RBR02_09555 [Desulfuromonadaceae bacterium]|nr:hypothetical protein [Desulfuromonadaceae bacterium]